MMLKRWGRLGAAIAITMTLSVACGKTPTPTSGATVGPATTQARTVAAPSPTRSASAPRIVSILPSCGQSTLDQDVTFTGVFEDPDGADDIKVAWLLFNINPILKGGVSLAFNRELDSAVVVTDAASNWSRSLDGGLGVGEDVSNDRALWRVKQSSVALEGKRLTVTWVLSFKSGLPAKSYNVFMMATDKSDNSSGWQPVGNWGVGVAPNPPCPAK